jgi:hypothetical protein
MKKMIYLVLEVMLKSGYTLYRVVKITNLILLIIVNLVEIQIKKLLGKYNGS